MAAAVGRAATTSAGPGDAAGGATGSSANAWTAASTDGESDGDSDAIRVSPTSDRGAPGSAGGASRGRSCSLTGGSGLRTSVDM